MFISRRYASALCAGAGLLLVISASSSITPAAATVPAVRLGVETEASILKEARSAFERKEYQRVVDRLEQASKTGALPVDAWGLKIRAQLGLGKPKEALLDYEQLHRQLAHDDVLLLREVALGFVIVLTKDMREQMRGAAYTALKDFESIDVVPLLEDGLSDASALVRALAVEALGKTEEGRRSPRLRQAIDDQAGLVKAAVLKV
jgi:hypothetical protein